MALKVIASLTIFAIAIGFGLRAFLGMMWPVRLTEPDDEDEDYPVPYRSFRQ